MSKIIRTSKPSVLPWYAAALVFVVLCAVLPVYQLWALLVSLGGACAAFGAAKKICPPRVVEHEVPFHTGVDDVDAMLTGMQKQLDTLHALNEALPDPNLSAAMTRMEKAGRSIVETVEASPAKAKLWGAWQKLKGQGDDGAIVVLYTQARQLNPARWSGNTRNWSPVGAVTLNPERDSIIKAHSPNNDSQPLAA